MTKKSVIKIPGKKGVHESEGVVVWAYVGTRRHKFFLSDQGYASQPVLSDWASGFVVTRLPEAGIFYCRTLKQRVTSAIAELVERTITQIEAEDRKAGVRRMSQEVFDAAHTRIYEVLDDVTVLNGKMTKHHKAQLEKNTLAAVEKIKAVKTKADTFAEVKARKPKKVKSK
jgi:hypothetical protein